VKSSLDHSPGGKWQFDESVTDCFDDMLERIIPAYAELRKSMFSIGMRFISDDGNVLDLGCSNGGSIAQFVDASKPTTRFHGLESSESMMVEFNQRFVNHPNVAGLIADISRLGLSPYNDIDLIIG
jgi:trans-aconitate methyltransferase